MPYAWEEKDDGVRFNLHTGRFLRLEDAFAVGDED